MTEDDASVTSANASSNQHRDADVANAKSVNQDAQQADDKDQQQNSSRKESIIEETPAPVSSNGKVNVRGAFDMFDLDASGKISAAEFGAVIRSLGENPTDDEVDSLLASVDADRDGSLDFGEFSKLYERRMAEREGVDEVEGFRKAFRVFDRDNSGKISAKEMRNIVTGYGHMKLTEKDADEMLKSVDADGDGLINYEVSQGADQ